MSFPLEPANYAEVSMLQSMVFSDSLKDLKNLRKQLYAAAEYFEFSYSSDDQKHQMMSTLKDYSIKALVNTVDHLGSVSSKVNDLLDEMFEEVSGTELHVSCIGQRLRMCREYIDCEGLLQQSLVITTPKYHKRYILPVGETMNRAVHISSKHQEHSLVDGDQCHRFKNVILAAINETPPLPVLVSKGRPWSSSPRLTTQQRYSFSGKLHNIKDIEKATVSPHRFPLLRSCSISDKPMNPSQPSRSRPNTPSPSLEIQQEQYVPEPRKSASMSISFEKDGSKDGERYPISKSKRLLKGLLMRRKLKKDETLYAYLDEY